MTSNNIGADNGHRTPDQTTSGGSADGTDPGDAGAGGAVNPGIANACNTLNSLFGPSQIAGGSMQLAYLQALATTTAPPPPKIENAGVTLGELTGWRCWKIGRSGFLKSCHTENYWAPGEPMAGELTNDTYGCGVHAWKTKADAIQYASVNRGPAIIGKVALWGEVLEHEYGYRAEFGKPLSFDYLVNAEDEIQRGFFWRKPPGDRLVEIRKLYGLAP